jgi:hypothetical protein
MVGESVTALMEIASRKKPATLTHVSLKGVESRSGNSQGRSYSLRVIVKFGGTDLGEQLADWKG